MRLPFLRTAVVVLIAAVSAAIPAHAQQASGDAGVEQSSKVRSDGRSKREIRSARRARRTQGKALLQAAASDAQKLKSLLDAGASPEGQPKAKQTPLGAAAERGNVEGVRLLLERGADRDAPARAHRTPLSLAIKGGHVEAASALLAAGADPLAGPIERSAVELAASRDNSLAFDTLRAASSATPDGSRIRDALLVRSAASGHIERVRLLLDEGASPDASVFASGALFVAVEAHQHGIARLLIERGATLDGTARGKPTPLDLAVRHDDSEMVALLTIGGARWERAGVHTRAKRRRLELRGADGAALLALARAGDIDHRDDDGTTLLMRASSAGVATMVRAALERGAAVDAERWTNFVGDGWTALLLAAAGGHEIVVEELRKAGADIHHRNAHGRSALMLATWYGHAAIARQLLAGGADAAVADAYGQTAATLAVTAGRDEMGAVLGVAIPPVPMKETKKADTAGARGKKGAATSSAPAAGAPAAKPSKGAGRRPDAPAPSPGAAQ